MAKQKYEITAFTKGIIGSPSETDIPEDAASYSVNIDPNAEDGVLRAIKEDTVLNNDGFKAAAYAKNTLTITRSAAAADNNSSTYNYNQSWFEIEYSDGTKDYAWFDQANTDPNTDPIVNVYGIEDDYEAGYEISIAEDASIENIVDQIISALPSSKLTKTKVGTTQITIEEKSIGPTSLINLGMYQGVAATGSLVVGGTLTNGQSFSIIDSDGFTQNFKFDITSSDTTGDNLELVTPVANRDMSSDTGFWTDSANCTYNATDDDWTVNITGTSNEDILTRSSLVESGKSYKVTYEVKNYSSGGVQMVVGDTAGEIRTANGTYEETIISAGTTFKLRTTSATTGEDQVFDIDNISVKQKDICVIGYNGITSAGDTATRIALCMNNAISNNHTNLNISVSTPTSTTINLTQNKQGAAGNTSMTGTTTNLTKNNFSGGITSLDSTIITNTANTEGVGIPFPMNDFNLINRGSNDSGQIIYDAIGINFTNNNVYKVEDIYGSDDLRQVSGLEIISSGIIHENKSTFVMKNKTAHIGLGSSKSSSTRWVGWIDNTQFNNTLSGYFSEKDALLNVEESASPVNLDYIVSFPFTWDADNANDTPFSGIQGYHAELALTAGEIFNWQLHNTDGPIYQLGDTPHGSDTTDSFNIQKYGKKENSAPKMGWTFRVTNTQDSSDNALVNAKKAYYDANTSAVDPGDVFQILEVGAEGATADAGYIATKLNYIGNVADANPDGNSGTIAFSYGIVEGGKYLYRISMTTTADNNAFTAAGVSRYMKYDISHIIGDSGICTISTCMTPVTVGSSKENNNYLTYGEGTMNAASVARQDIRGLHNFLWVSNNEGDLFRINILDLDELHSDETYKGVKLDYKVNFDYSNISRCSTTEHSNTFAKWYGAIHRATDAEEYEWSKSSEDTGRNISGNGGSTITWDDNVNWDRTPSAVKIVGICETQTCRGYKDSDSIKGETSTWAEYVFELTSGASGPQGKDGIAHKWSGGDYALDEAVELRMERHSYDVGDVLTVFNRSTTASDYATNHANIIGNTIVSRVIDENHVVIGANSTSGSDGTIAVDKIGLYTSKVWVLFAKQDVDASFERWDLFLYNFNPSTIAADEKAIMYDRTPPYSELGISKWNGTGATVDQDPEYNAQNGTFEIGIDKESVMFYDAGYAEDFHTCTGTWRSQNRSWPSTSENNLRRIAYKRRDGSVVSCNNGINERSQRHISWGSNAGWYGDTSGVGLYRKVKPVAHTLQPEAIRDFRYTQNVCFISKVSGKFSTKPGLTYRHQTDGADQVLHIGNTWETYNDDFCTFVINDHAAHREGYSLNYGNSYRNGKGNDQSDSTTAVIVHEGHGYDYYTYDESDNSFSNTNSDGDVTGGLGDRGSHYFSGGRFKKNTNIGGNDSFSTYDGTKMVPTVVPYSNVDPDNTPYYQGQIGDYLFIDRKWLSMDLDIENSEGAIRLDSLRSTLSIYESEGANRHLKTRFNNNPRLATGTGWTTSTGIENGLYGDNNGWIEVTRNSTSDGGNQTDSRPVLDRQCTWMSMTSKSNSSDRKGEYDWDARIYAPSFSTLHYLSCTMRRLENQDQTFDIIRHAKHAHINEINDINTATDKPATGVASGARNYQPNGYSLYGIDSHVYLVSGRIKDGNQEKSVVAAYKPYSYGYYPLHPTDAVNEWHSGYAHYANSALVPLQSYKSYPNIPKLIFNNSKFAGKVWQKDDTTYAHQDGFLLTGNRTINNQSNKQFTIRGDDTDNTGSWTWQWEDTPEDGFMHGGTFEDIDDTAAGSNLLSESDSLITVTAYTAGDTGEFPANTNIRYKISVLYDGYQESPLSTFFWDKDVGGTAQSTMEVKVSIADPEVFSPRATHLVLYRRVSSNTLFRMVKQIPLDEGWVYLNGLYTYTFLDDHRTGSYEALTGMSEDTEITHLNYSLSCEINDELFAADCYTDVIEKGDARRYIFKSKPGNYSQFDLKKDYLILKTIPTALVSFNGRVYAFDRSNTYKINPDSMVIEDIYEGVGCLSQNAVAISEFGMCFADSNNVYLHDGNTPIQIANNILNISTLEGFKVGYQKAVENTESYPNNEKPKVFYDGEANSFVVFLVGTCTQTCSNTVSRAYAYNLARKRWDYWEAPLCKQARSGQDSDILITDNKNLYKYKGSDSDYRSWEFRTKHLSLAQLGNNKRFHRLKVFGAPNISDDNVTTASDPLNDNIVVLVDGVPQDITLENIRYEKSFMGAKMAGTINNTDDTSTITFDSATGDAPMKGAGGAKYPVVDNYIQVDDEIMKITSVSTSTMLVSRAKLGTTKAAHTNSRLYYIAPSIKLPSKCKGKKIEIHLKGQNGVVDGIGIDFINKRNG